MKINEKIIVILKAHKIPVDDGLCYLISVFHGYNPSFIPLDFKIKMNETKIVTPTITGRNTSWNWSLPLYEGVETAFDWVKTEFIVLFKNRNKKKTSNSADTTKRMKKFFSSNPEYRKEEVIEATKNYLNNTDADYIRFPHYFIKKGRGVDETSDLLTWLERLKEEKEELKGRQGSATTMQ